MRLQGPNTSISQTCSVVAGAKIYFSTALRSSNDGGNSLSVVVDWLNSSNSIISSTTVGSATGFLSAWTQKAITGYTTVPAGAAFAVIRVSTNASQPGGAAFWDVDDVVMQAVLSQSISDNLAEVSNGSSSDGYGVFRAVGVNFSAVYGQNYLRMLGGAFSEELLLNNTTFSMAQGGSGGNAFMLLSQGSATGIAIVQRIMGSLYSGYNGTVASASGRNVKNGLIV